MLSSSRSRRSRPAKSIEAGLPPLEQLDVLEPGTFDERRQGAAVVHPIVPAKADRRGTAPGEKCTPAAALDRDRRRVVEILPTGSGRGAAADVDSKHISQMGPRSITPRCAPWTRSDAKHRLGCATRDCQPVGNERERTRVSGTGRRCLQVLVQGGLRAHEGGHDQAERGREHEPSEQHDCDPRPDGHLGRK